MIDYCYDPTEEGDTGRSSIQIDDRIYDGQLIKSGIRNHHPMSAYVGKRVIDVSNEPSDDSWTNWYLFESETPLPTGYDPTFIHSLSYASFMDVDRDDCEAPGQLFRRRAIISRMTSRRVLITQSGGRDI